MKNEPSSVGIPLSEFLNFPENVSNLTARLKRLAEYFSGSRLGKILDLFFKWKEKKGIRPFETNHE